MFTPVAPARDALSVIYAYPNDYTVGICSLGYQLVWAFFQTRPDIACTRMFMDAHEDLPQRPDLLGFSLSWELDYVNLLSQLGRLGIPILASERTSEHPLVFGGGPVLTANPEPFAAFFDVVLLGDGEDSIAAFVDAIAATKDTESGPASREARIARLKSLSQVPGVYAPLLYEPEYAAAGGPLTGVHPIDGDVAPFVEKQTYRGNQLARSTVVSPLMAWENIYMVEVVRSCPEMCRFCMASYLTLPFRTAPLNDSLIPAIEAGLAVTDRIGLLGASVTQHPQFDELLQYMVAEERAHVRMSIASVRTNTVTPQLAAALASRGTKSVTVAVESGSERMRRIVNKKLAQEDIITCAANAQEGGLQSLKLYGMVGVPGEEEEDVDATIALMQAVKAAAPKLRLTLGCSTFVPKSHTPFQWWGVSPKADKRLKRLEKVLGREGIQFRPESYKWSLVQALLSRGDRRLTSLLLQVREYGDTLGAFRRAFKDLEGTLPLMDYYVHRNMTPGQDVLPWVHLHGPLPEATLVKHAQEAVQIMDSARDEADAGSVRTRLGAAPVAA
ncbi:hypothetical protein WJX72_000754 [[Myrmecia] bisecta]|uniref:Radical SAM core domain-containing protein n=1 Tax=[Myrmecia] bisecta TaxID=41462 RepID=A0AAW1P8B3_9CHLO